MDIFFQVSWSKEKDKWIATAYERPKVKGQPPTALASAAGDEPHEALQSCCERVEAT